MAQEATRGGAPILIVEDDQATADLIGEVLAGAGYELLQAREGAEALRLVRDRKPGAIILDLGLPGLDGRTFLMSLRADEATKRTPVIVISANSETLTTLERRSVSQVMPKPFDVSRLLSAVESVRRTPEGPAVV